LSLSLGLLCPCSYGADAGPLAIAVPDGFDGPVRSDSDGGTTTGWVKHRPGRNGGTLLQVSAIDGGPSLDATTPAERSEATRHYLLEFARGIAQTLDRFEMGEIEETALAGLPAARLRWTGKVRDDAAIGVLYCVLVGHTIVSLGTQDVGTTISPAMYSAMGAIEGVRVR
jgi:hypothetical protein